MTPLTPTSEDTAIYELCVLCPSNLSQKDAGSLLKEIEALFEEAEGKLVSKDLWGQRGLAYPIKKEVEGNFVVYYYDLLPAKVKEIDRQLRILPNVLRHMIVKPPKGYEIVKYSERYEQWLKDRSTAEETKRKDEEKELQKKVTDRAKIQAKRAEATKKKEAKGGTLEEADLSKKLEELISDNPLDI